MISREQTVSMSRGRTAIEHDLRIYSPANVDASLTKYNVVLVDELKGRTLEEYTNEQMKPYIDEYNSKQKRSDRKKSYDYVADYIAEQNNKQVKRQGYKAGQIAYEYVLQFGDRTSFSTKEVVADSNKRKGVLIMFQQFIKFYQSSYPHMKIVLATIHMDEPNGTPHMHILVQPIGEGYKQGLSHQISLTKALACDGFERSTKKSERLSLTRWQDDVKDNIMQPIMEACGMERKYGLGEKKHMSPSQYIMAMEEKDKIIEEAEEEAEEIIAKAKDDIDEIASQRDFLINGVPGSKNLNEKGLKELLEIRKKAATDYNNIVNGYVDSNGNQQPGYNELLKSYNELREYPEKIMETEAGQRALEEAKDEIVERVHTSFADKIIGFVERKIINKLKYMLVQPLYDAIDEMMRGHMFKLNEDC